MVSVVKTKLKTLCCDDGWSYGVFWRFDRRNPMLLTVEDAYFEEPLETVANSLLQQVHLLGEGIVGQAAFTGKQRWIMEGVRGEHCCYVDNIGLQDESEMHWEFSAGIKAIGVIPVERLGVVQVGATKKIPESLEFLEKVQKLFGEMGNIDGRLHLENNPSSLNNDDNVLNVMFASLLSSRNSYSRNLISADSDSHTNLTGDARSAEDLIPLLGHKWDKYSGDLVSMLGGVSNFNYQMQMPISHPKTPISSHEHQHLQPNSLMKNPPSGNSWSCVGSALTSLEQSLPSNFPHAYSASTKKNMLTCFSSSVKSSCASSTVSTPSSSSEKGLAGSKKMHDITGISVNNQQSAPCMQEICGELPSVSGGQKRSAEFLQHTEDCSNSCLVDDLSEWLSDLPEHGLFGIGSSLDKSLAHSRAFSSISSVIDRGDYASELPINQATGSLLNSISNAFTVEEKTINIQNAEREVFDEVGVKAGCKLEPDYYEDGGPWKGLFSELGLEEFFEATEPGFQEAPPFAQTKTVEQSYCDSKEFQSPNLSSSGSVKTSVKPVHYLCKEQDIVHRKAFFPKSQVGLWIDDSYSINTRGATVMPPKRTEEPMKAPRKRARPGESTRPRPKDRQQIQDRLKELRRIIPNGAKCSIDALLDRTIKHMLFLQNMMKYADKLKRADETKLIGQDNNLVLKNERDRRDVGDGSRGGATWAYEVGGQAMVCPIVVEDLGPPGQMLIEMLCDDRGLFLEIADVIRGFGLDILKGEMGVREGKIRSRFIVEANRHVTRMDVFWSLIQLVQETNSRAISLTKQPADAVDSKFFSCNDYKESLLPLPIS